MASKKNSIESNESPKASSTNKDASVLHTIVNNKEIDKRFGLILICGGLGAASSTLYSFILEPNKFDGILYTVKNTNSFLLTSFLAASTACLLTLLQLIKLSRSKRKETSFQDIDKARAARESLPKFSIAPELLEANAQQKEIKYELDKKLYTLEEKIRSCETQKFLFLKITGSLSEQVELFDNKASVMLDKGISKATFGVWFLILSIVVWQLFFLFHPQPADPRHYIGMASCSVIFIFMQALAGWCLKQHRAYIDASLYVIKIRSIFEKKMQAFLLLQEHGEDKGGYQKVLDDFLEEISWPPEPLSAKKQTSYIKDAAATISEVTSAMRTLQPTSQKPTRRNRSPLI